MSERVFRMVKNTVKNPGRYWHVRFVLCLSTVYNYSHVHLGSNRSANSAATFAHEILTTQSLGQVDRLSMRKSHVLTYTRTACQPLEIFRRPAEFIWKLAEPNKHCPVQRPQGLFCAYVPASGAKACRERSLHVLVCVYVCHSEFKEATFGIVLRECWRVLYKHWERDCAFRSLKCN